jgi:fibro-slime domain-containing protein
MINRQPLFTACTTVAAACAGLGSLVPARLASALPLEAPQQLQLEGIVRDFREKNAPGGHPDFEVTPAHGFKHYMGNVATELGTDGNPVFTGTGHVVKKQWKDAQNRQICWHVAQQHPMPGDTAGQWGASDTGGVQSAASFDKWFEDVPGVNMSAELTITLVRQADGTYVFDDNLDAAYAALGGFFPIEDQLFGNPGGSPDRNFHFTYEIHSTFVYDAEAVQIFKFIGDDDVYVFIDDELVIDLGGVHAAVEQYVDLNRLGLEDGKTYKLDFFFAERHRTESNFRIVTNLKLQSGALPTVSTIFD